MNRSVRSIISLAESLTEQDTNVLLSLHEHRLLTTPQLQRLFFSGGENEQSNARLARLRLAKLEQRGLTGRLARRMGGVRAGSSGQVWQLAARGSRLVMHLLGQDGMRGREAFEPGEAFVRHTTKCGEVYVRAVEMARAGTCELLEYAAEPTCWRSFVGAYGESKWLKPDGYVRLGVDEYEERAFIEVDLATHGRAAIRRKLGTYAAYLASGGEDSSSRVLWLVPDKRRRSWLKQLVDELPKQMAVQHQVSLFEDVVAALLRQSVSSEKGGDR